MKKVIIIGVTSGIGEELCRQYIEEGNFIGGIGRNEKKLKAIQNEFPDNFHQKVLDISKVDEVLPVLDELIDKTGGMDIIIIASSISNKNPDLIWDIEKEVFDINILGYSAVLNFAAQFFKKQGFGHIVGISSIAKFFGNKNPAYNASKAFESIYMEGMRFNLNGYPNIFITDIRPGFVDTPLVAENRQMFWLVPVKKAALQIRKAIQKKKRHVYISKRWRILAFILPWFPFWAKRKLIV